MQNSILQQNKWLIKELIIWSRLPMKKSSLFDGTALKNDKFHLQKNFRSHEWNQASLHSPSPASSVSMVTHFYTIPIQVLQPVKGDRMLF